MDKLVILNNVVSWLDSHKFYGIIVALFVAIAIGMSGYATNESADNSTRLTSIENKMDSMQVEMKVMNAKLDILVDFVNKAK